MDNELKELLEKAKRGNAQSQFEFGENLYYGIDVEEDTEEGLYWIRKAAEQGLLEAELAMGELTRYADTEEEYQEGMMYLQRAYEKGSLEALECILERAWIARAYEYAREGYDILSLFGTSKQKVTAFLKLAEMYSHGLGCERDSNKAERCFKQIIEQDIDEKDKNYYLGRYGFFLFTEARHEEAFPYLVASANAGNRESKETLGIWYYDGIHVTRDRNKAVQILMECAKEDFVFFPEVYYAIGECYYHGWGGLKQNYYIAFEYYLKALYDRSYTVGKVLGKMYNEGIGVERNVLKAKKCILISELYEEGYVEEADKLLWEMKRSEKAVH